MERVQAECRKCGNVFSTAAVTRTLNRRADEARCNNAAYRNRRGSGATGFLIGHAESLLRSRPIVCLVRNSGNSPGAQTVVTGIPVNLQCAWNGDRGQLDSIALRSVTARPRPKDAKWASKATTGPGDVQPIGLSPIKNGTRMFRSAVPRNTASELARGTPGSRPRSRSLPVWPHRSDCIAV